MVEDEDEDGGKEKGGNIEETRQIREKGNERRHKEEYKEERGKETKRRKRG